MLGASSLEGEQSQLHRSKARGHVEAPATEMMRSPEITRVSSWDPLDQPSMDPFAISKEIGLNAGQSWVVPQL